MLYEKGIETFNSNYSPNTNGNVYINLRYNSLSEENKKRLAEIIKKRPNNYFIHQSASSYCELGGNSEIDEERPVEVIFGIQKLTGQETYEELQEIMRELASVFEKQIYMEGVFSREEVLENKHHKLGDMAKLGEQYIEQCTSTSKHSNKQIARRENLLYSKKYNLFFTDSVSKSRYIESLYRKENDQRSETEIAKQEDCYYSIEEEMFFESEREYQQYKIKKAQQKMKSDSYANDDSTQYKILPTDLAIASKAYKIGGTIVNKFKQMMTQIKDMWR